jgi:hypothetical protein
MIFLKRGIKNNDSPMMRICKKEFSSIINFESGEEMM